MGIKAELGQKIKRMRLKKGMTQEELAEEADIRQRTLSGIETGEKFVMAETLDKLACAMNTSVEKLFETEHYKETPILVSEINNILSELSESNARRDIEVL